MDLPYEDIFRRLGSDLSNKKDIPPDINLIVTGGGFTGYYATGIFGILIEMMNRNLIKIHHYYGASVGAMACTCLLGNISMLQWIKYYQVVREDYAQNGTYPIEAFRKILVQVLPEDIHLRANGRLHISVRPYSSLLNEHVINQYHSKQNLIDVVLASCTIPFITINQIGYNLLHNGSQLLTIDGIWPPRPNHDNEYPTLKINLMQYLLPYRHRLTPTLKSIDLLIMHGCIDGYNFFMYGESNSCIYFKKRHSIIKILFKNIWKILFIILFVYWKRKFFGNLISNYRDRLRTFSGRGFSLEKTLR